ncbi:hypothetical protein CDD83_10192 [Cordyceps sp. RAO-2017]|nr:hypothetical protein CDD83_10192 [Cordyceps sp. RAO-2017]
MLEILDSLRLYVLMDSKIPREIKSRSFNTKTLMRFLTLYKTAGTSADPAEKDVVSERVDQFLKYICTAPSAGVLYPYKGLYPKNAEDAYSDYPPKGRGECDGDGVRGDWSDKEFSVFNFVLCEFAEKLRPGSNPKHSELLVSIFTAAPELIARYFHDNRTFVFEPKLSSTWIGGPSAHIHSAGQHFAPRYQ